MKVKNKLLVSALSLAGLLSPQASAVDADTVCSIVYDTGDVLEINDDNGEDVTDGTIPVPNTTIAVASNFYAPAIELAEAFLASDANTGSYTAIGVCHNATGHLVNEITGNNPAVIDGEWLSAKINYKYGLFAAANATAPENLAATYKIDPVLTYAKGIPAFLAGATLIGNIQNPTWNDLVVADPSGVSGLYFNDGQIGGNTGPVVINTSTIDEIGIALPSAAPYGLAAQTIINAMGQWSTPVSVSGNPLPACSATATANGPGICQYANIDITYAQTVLSASTLDAGWTSWAQILSGENTNPYVIFPDYDFPQKAVRLTNPNPAGADDAATAFWNFLGLTYPNSTTNAFFSATGLTWNGWLEKKGYGPILFPN
jgi:hypothetical protein